MLCKIKNIYLIFFKNNIINGFLTRVKTECEKYVTIIIMQFSYPRQFNCYILSCQPRRAEQNKVNIQ